MHILNRQPDKLQQKVRKSMSRANSRRCLLKSTNKRRSRNERKRKNEKSRSSAVLSLFTTRPKRTRKPSKAQRAWSRNLWPKLQIRLPLNRPPSRSQVLHLSTKIHENPPVIPPNHHKCRLRPRRTVQLLRVKPM